MEATVFKEGLARADTLPLVVPVLGAADLPRGARVRLRLGEVDLITLDVSGTVVQRLDTVPEAAVSAEDDTEEETVAGPIAIAVDVTDTSEEEAGAAPAAGAGKVQSITVVAPAPTTSSIRSYIPVVSTGLFSTKTCVWVSS